MGVLLLLLFLAILTFLVIKAISSSDSISTPRDECNYNEPITVVNGVPIEVSEDEIKQHSIKDFEEAVKLLKSVIKEDLESTDDPIRKRVLENLLNRSIHTQAALSELDYLYNDGKLRTNEEVAKHNEWKHYATQRENYDTECHRRNVLCWIIPFVATFIITMCFFDWFMLGIPIALILGLVAAIIGSLISNSINIQNGKKYQVSEYDQRFQKESLNQKIGITSTIAAGYSIGKHAKQAKKDLLNVDSWEEMK